MERRPPFLQVPEGVADGASGGSEQGVPSEIEMRRFFPGDTGLRRSGVPVRPYTFRADRSECGGGGRVLGSYRCSIEQERFLVDAEIFEKEYDVRERPWEGSCLEIFLADGEKRKLQFCIRHDGKVFQVADGVVSDCSSVLLIPGERKSDSFRIRVEIPLLLLGERWTEKREFLFNFQQTVKQGEMFLRNSLSGFSVCGVSAFAKAVFRA